MITYLLFLLASICNAFMDRTENSPEFGESILRNKNQKFWLKSISWQYAKRVFGWKFDAWHLFKTLMIVFCILSAVMYEQVFPYGLDFLALGIIWNVGFTKTYGYFLVRKELRGKFL